MSNAAARFLSGGAIALVHARGAQGSPCLQIVDITWITYVNIFGNPYRYCELTLSDGEHSIIAIAESALNAALQSGEMRVHDVVQLTDFDVVRDVAVAHLRAGGHTLRLRGAPRLPRGRDFP